MLIIHFIIRQEDSPEYFKYLLVGLVPLFSRFKEFYVCSANSRGALTPSNVPRTFSVRLNRFTGTTRADLHCVMEE